MSKIIAKLASKLPGAHIATVMLGLERGTAKRGAVEREWFGRIRNNRERRREVADAVYGMYLDDGGKAGDWQAVLDWIVKNLPAIISMLMLLFA